MELYKKYVDEDNILHLGENFTSVIVDIERDGTINVNIDNELVETYGTDSDDDNGDDDDHRNVSIGSQTSRIDNKPMG